MSQAPYVVYNLPALRLGELLLPGRHRRASNAMREPPEEVAIRMVINMRRSEIGWSGIEPGGGWTIAMSSGAMARGTVLLEHLLSLLYSLRRARHRVGAIGGRIGIHEDDA